MEKIASKKARFPRWLRQEIPDALSLTKFLALKNQGVNTVCLEARCPNWFRCLNQGSLAFMVLGKYCTRNCQFCAVEKSSTRRLLLDRDEPERILKVIKELKLNFVIITSVTRDDLDDGGSEQFAQTIRLIRNYKKDIKIEVLIPDFLGLPLRKVISSQPDILAHNLETVPRLYPLLRKEANYQRSLSVLKQAKKFSNSLITKSSLLLGMGETEKEVIQVMKDLYKVNCDVLILGQYLAPTRRHYPVREFITPEQFKRYKDIGLRLRLRAVLSSPLARTSYKAEEVYNSLKKIDKKKCDVYFPFL